MTYVDTGLYIGTVDDAYDRPQLEKKGVTHILTLETKPLQQQATEGMILRTLLCNIYFSRALNFHEFIL